MKPKQLTDYLDSYSDVIDSISVMSMDQTVPFIESSYKGINFDKVKEEYCKKHKIKDSQSNDSVISVSYTHLLNVLLCTMSVGRSVPLRPVHQIASHSVKDVYKRQM